MILVSVPLYYGIGSINLVSIYIVSIKQYQVIRYTIIFVPIRIYQRFSRVLGFFFNGFTTVQEFSPLTCWPRPLGSKPRDFHQPCGNYPGLSALVDQRPGRCSLH